MSFWDRSAVLPLVLDEPATVAIDEIRRVHGAPVVWWATLIECHSALARRVRTGDITAEQKQDAERLLRTLAEAWSEVQATAALRNRACRLLAVHDLRAADAMQLAAALAWSGEQPVGRAFVCLDSRLREAAAKEGFRVLPEKALPE
jgi:hypothetical protein